MVLLKNKNNETKKKEEMKVKYQYFEPKTEQEKQEQEHKLNMAFDILFEATFEKMKQERLKRHSQIN
jgi:hypothetical protein